MRCQTAAKAKFKTRHVGAPLRQRPRAGTLLGNLYDLLQANKGMPIEISLCSRAGRNGKRIEQLKDFYGLDIRMIKYGRWILAGEWFGRVYVDYIAEHLNSVPSQGECSTAAAPPSPRSHAAAVDANSAGAA